LWLGFGAHSQLMSSHRVMHRRGTMGKPDQKDLNENMAATQGLSHMITDCKKLFQVGGCGVLSLVLPSWGLWGQCSVRGGHPLGQPWGITGPAEPCSRWNRSQAAGSVPREAASVLFISFSEELQFLGCPGSLPA